MCEKSDRLGGVLRCEEHVAFKEKLDYYLNQQEAFVKKSGIDLRLNTEVTPEYARELGADVIIAALGASPIKPPIPGIDGANVMSAQDAYTAAHKLGKNVVILGAGLVGIELGLHLIANGKSVKIVEMLDTINDGGNFLHMPGLRAEMKKLGLTVSFNTRAVKITDTAVTCETPDGEVTIPADSVIYAVGQRAEQTAATALNLCAPEFYMLGDCVSPRNITSATSEAYMIARNIGKF